ncbi:MAG: hypothetical protein CXZ00_01075 [Acidobacteria bacterium]|nr:MAG: hypothetical protein CXZ00_01075 [Acidobacteriota bacterium]
MFSLSKKTITTILLVPAALLCTSPLAAALKKPKVKAHTATSSRSSAASRRSSRTAASSSHKSKTYAVSTRKAHIGTGLVSAATVSKPKPRGQQSISQARTIEIQEALIRERYLSGEPTGEFDVATREALVRFQGDNHWQTKILPDSRALIKLGLGPSHEGLLNPETAAVAMPRHPGSEKFTSGGSN